MAAKKTNVIFGPVAFWLFVSSMALSSVSATLHPCCLRARVAQEVPPIMWPAHLAIGDAGDSGHQQPDPWRL